MRLLLYIEIIHEFPIRSIEILLAFPQADLDVGVLMDLTLRMGVYVNRG